LLEAEASLPFDEIDSGFKCYERVVQPSLRTVIRSGLYIIERTWPFAGGVYLPKVNGFAQPFSLNLVGIRYASSERLELRRP